MRELWICAALIAAMAFSTGCKHTVEIRSTPEGATVSQNGVVLGKTPFLYEEQLGPKETQRLSIESNGVERELSVSREQFQMSGVGIGTLIGCAGCCLVGGGAAAASTALPPLGFIAVAGPLLPIAGAIVGWLQFGFFSPDTIDVNMHTGEVQTFPLTPATLGEPMGDGELPPPAPPQEGPYNNRANESGEPAKEESSPVGDAPPPEGDAPPAGTDEPPPPHTDPAYGATQEDDDEYGVIPPNPAPLDPPAATEGEDGFGTPLAPDETGLRF